MATVWKGGVSLYPRHKKIVDSLAKQRGVKAISTNIQYIIDDWYQSQLKLRKKGNETSELENTQPNQAQK